MSTIAEKFVDKALEWEKAGVPYQHRSWSRNGCDCTGFIIGLFKELGYVQKYIPRIYPPDWNQHAMADNYIVDEIAQIADEVPNAEVALGDIIFFTMGRCICHSGIYIGNNVFIHTRPIAGKIQKSTLRNSPWSVRWVKTFRINETKLNEVE